MKTTLITTGETVSESEILVLGTMRPGHPRSQCLDAASVPGTLMSTNTPLDPGQFLVRQTDPSTGVRLTADQRWAPPGAEHEEVFPSREAAEATCWARLAERPDTEWWIYDHTDRAVTSIMNQEYWRAQLESRPPGLWQRVLRILGIVR